MAKHEVVKHDGNSDKSWVSGYGSTGQKAREVAQAQDARRERGSSDYHTVHKAK